VCLEIYLHSSREANFVTDEKKTKRSSGAQLGFYLGGRGASQNN